MDIVLIPLIQTVNVIIDLYIWALVINIIIGWLTQFGIINGYNQFIFTIRNVLFRITEPALMPIRRFLPEIGGLDFSPIILIILLNFTRSILLRLVGHLL